MNKKVLLFAPALLPAALGDTRIRKTVFPLQEGPFGHRNAGGISGICRRQRGLVY